MRLGKRLRGRLSAFCLKSLGFHLLDNGGAQHGYFGPKAVVQSVVFVSCRFEAMRPQREHAGASISTRSGKVTLCQAAKRSLHRAQVVFPLVRACLFSGVTSVVNSRHRAGDSFTPLMPAEVYKPSRMKTAWGPCRQGGERRNGLDGSKCASFTYTPHYLNDGLHDKVGLGVLMFFVGMFTPGRR